MSAIDLLGRLSGFDWNLLGALQRVLLVTDGTLTEILEAFFGERVRLVKLSQKAIAAGGSHGLFEPKDDETLVERKILLQGEHSGRNYVYAESLVAVDRLGPAFRDALLNSSTPLGRLWLDHRLETFKQMHDVRYQRANGLAHYFESAEEEPLLARTYRVISGGRVVMVISEYFPAVYSGAPELPGMERSAMAGAMR